MDNNRIAGLDHLRALAITLVFIFHYRLFAHPDWVVTIGRFGWTGVDLFFVLSGYLIASQIFKGVQQNNFSFKSFFLKRFFRIQPAYLAVLSLYFLVPAFREWEALSPLWKFLTFTQNFGLDQRYNRTFSHAWSLCIEEQFYLLLPLSVIALNYLKAGKKAAYVIVALFLLGFAVRITSWNLFVTPNTGTDIYVVEWFKWIYYPTYNRLDGLLAGISIAGLVQFFPCTSVVFKERPGLFLIAGFVLITAAYFLCMEQFSFAASVFGYPLIAIAYGCMVVSATSGKSILNRFTSKVTSSIATLSYAIYLTHKAAIHFAQEQFSGFGIDPDSSLMFFISLLVSLLAAIVLHYAIERPFLKLKERVLR